MCNISTIFVKTTMKFKLINKCDELFANTAYLTVCKRVECAMSKKKKNKLEDTEF